MKHVFEIEAQVGDLRYRTIAKSGKHPWVKHYQTAIYAQHFNIGRHKSPLVVNVMEVQGARVSGVGKFLDLKTSMAETEECLGKFGEQYVFSACFKSLVICILAFSIF